MIQIIYLNGMKKVYQKSEYTSYRYAGFIFEVILNGSVVGVFNINGICSITIG